MRNRVERLSSHRGLISFRSLSFLVCWAGLLDPCLIHFRRLGTLTMWLAFETSPQGRGHQNRYMSLRLVLMSDGCARAPNGNMGA